MDYMIWNQILTELVFAISGENELDRLIKRAAVAFLKKLDCAQVSILQYENSEIKTILAIPRILSKQPCYCKLISELEEMFKDDRDEEVFSMEKDLFYYAFTLQDFGLLLVGRSEPIKEVFLKELIPVTKILARNCFYCYSTARKKEMIELELEQERHLLRVIMDTIPDLIFYRDTNGVYRSVNKATAEFFSLNLEEIIGSTIWELQPPIDANLCWKTDCEVFQTGKVERYETEIKRHDGLYCPFEIIKAPVYDEKSARKGIVAVCRNTRERKHYEQELERIGTHDQLTDLYNRRFLERKIKFLDTKNQLPISIIMGDLNGLKMINDIFGHQKGDLLIRKAAKIIKDSCRQNDLVFRWGGDEFVIFLPRTSPEIAERVCQRIKKNCSEQECEHIKISIAFGRATKNNVEEDIWQVFKKANDSMYSSKAFSSKQFRDILVISLKQMLSEKSMDTKEHRERLKTLCKKLGVKLNLSTLEIEKLFLLAEFHDIGKVAIDSKVLMRSGQLTDKEQMEFRRHPGIGLRFAQGIPELFPIAEYIFTHHEQWDGKGYPQGLEGENIPLLSRIFAVVDTFDVLTNDRLHREALSYQKAKDIIKSNKGKKFDPHVVDAFIRLNLETPLEN